MDGKLKIIVTKKDDHKDKDEEGKKTRRDCELNKIKKKKNNDDK
jgi:hypothetical protein